jgi:hypothetical protein
MGTSIGSPQAGAWSASASAISAGCVRSAEAERMQIQFTDESLDHPHRVVFGD